MTSKGGRLYLVGLGPGDPNLLAPIASAVLQEVDVVVGFRGYMEQIAALTEGKEVVSMELGQELERAAKAVELAYAGSTVAVVSSGDAGVYGMAGAGISRPHRPGLGRNCAGSCHRARGFSSAIGGISAGFTVDAGFLRH